MSLTDRMCSLHPLRAGHTRHILWILFKNTSNILEYRVVLSDVLGGKDVVEGRDGRTDVSDSYQMYSCRNGIISPDSFLHFTPC
jgi:hypothetical protein